MTPPRPPIPPDFHVRIDLSENRSQPLVTGARIQFLLDGDPEQFDVQLEPANGWIAPGTSGTAEVWFLIQEAWRPVPEGAAFTLIEGTRPVATGSILARTAA
jgi:hypothetical protein